MGYVAATQILVRKNVLRAIWPFETSLCYIICVFLNASVLKQDVCGVRFARYIFGLSVTDGLDYRYALVTDTSYLQAHLSYRRAVGTGVP